MNYFSPRTDDTEDDWDRRPIQIDPAAAQAGIAAALRRAFNAPCGREDVDGQLEALLSRLH